MKLWKAVLFLLVMALAGCGGSHDARVTAELDRADSLLRTSDTAAHSAALRQMVALDTASALQADEALRARHALLLVQARYKCYMTEPADSGLIDQARRYYADHHGSSADHERYTRSLIYSGAVAEELGHPQQAMQYYLEAEDTADPNDHFNLGFTNLRMAVLLSSLYVSDESDFDRYKKALSHFEKTGQLYYQYICFGNMGGILRSTNNKAAKRYLQKAMNLSRNEGDSLYYYDFTEQLAMSYVLDSCHQEARNLILICITGNQKYKTIDTYLTAAYIYSHLNINDSANYFLKQAKSFTFADRDSLKELSILAQIASNERNYKQSETYNQEYNLLLERIDSKPDKRHIANVEKLHHEQQTKALRHDFLLLKIVLLILAVTAFLSILLILLRVRRKTNHLKETLVSLENERINEHEALLQKIDKYKENLKRKDLKSQDQERALKNMDILIAFLGKHIQLMRNLIRITNTPNKDAKTIKKEQISHLVRRDIATNSFWDGMELFVNEDCGGFVNYLKTHHPNLNESDIRLLTLLSCGFSYAEIALIMQYSREYISVKRDRAIKKLNISVPFDQFLASFKQ